MNGRLAPHSLILVMMMLTGAAPHSCPASCKICSVKLTNCDSVSSLHEVLPGLSNATEAIILLNGGLSVIPPASFQNFSTLRWLYINGCRVTALANRTFLTGPGNSLQELDLNNNRLESCSVDILAFAGLARLEKLILTNNALDALKMSWFTDLILLTKLNVSANMITYIAPRTFESLVMLSHLDLADNRIQYLHTGTFNGLDSLTELNISRNRIVSIDDHAFDPLKALRILWLVGNRLIALPNLPELVENVYLRENPWECSCKLVNLIRVLVEKVADNAKVLCDRPAQLKGQKAMDVGPDICSNASAPGGNTPQGRPQSLNLLYSFIGGLFCAVIICLAVCFFVKRSKQGRATNPEDQREDVVDSSHKSATGGIPIKMAAAKELTRHHLRPASKQAPPNNQRIDSFENCPSELSGSTYSGRKKNTGIVSPMHSPSMDPVARSPKKTIDGAEKPVSEANQEIKGSNQRGSQFLGSAGNSMSENSAKTEGLSKSFTAPDLLFTNQEQNLFNFSGLRTSFGDHRGSSPAISKHPLSYATEGLQPTPDKPNLHGMQSIQYINDGHNLHSRQGIPHIPDDLNVYSTQCLQPTHDDANYNSTQVLQPSCNDQKSFSEEGPQTTPDDPNLCSMQGLQNIPEEPQRFSKGAVQPTNDKLKICIPKSLPTIPDHSKLDSLEALQATPDKEKTHMTQNVQSSAADQESCSTQSTPGPSKYYSAQRLHPAQKDSKSCPLPGLPAAAEDPKVFDATGLQLIPRDPKYTRTEGVLPVTEDAECIRTPDCLPAAEELQCSFRFASAEDLGCLPSSDAAHNPAKRARDAPDGPFHKGTSKETDEIQIMAPGSVKYFETQHDEKGLESMNLMESPKIYSDNLDKSLFPLQSIGNTKANEGRDRRNLSKKCKTWSTFSNITHHSTIEQARREEPGDCVKDNSRPSERRQDCVMELRPDDMRSEESANPLGSGRATKQIDSLTNSRLTEPLVPLRVGRSKQMTDSMRNCKSGMFSDSLQNGGSSELSVDDSTSQRDLVSFFGSSESLTSDSGDDYGELDTKNPDNLDRTYASNDLTPSTHAVPEKEAKSVNRPISTQQIHNSPSAKAKSAGQCARKESTLHRRSCRTRKSYSEGGSRREQRRKKHSLSLPLTRHVLSRERFWKYHSNCCDEYKPCPTATEVMHSLKGEGRETSNPKSAELTRERFWKYHTHCCDEYKPCPLAKNVLHHLKNTPTERSSEDSVRLTRERFWKYHRNCCDEYKPCLTAKKVMQRLRAAPSDPGDTEFTQTPPSDVDLLEGNDRLSGNLLTRLSQRMERKVVSPWK
ncbi:uncharacterized protein [Ambystoma mexicanum]|uniref:uncharacterized protein isoform X2 n=1 Tax=Ambystoma mexicanum TaxID=8296 RepID=UPI0037E916C2